MRVILLIREMDSRPLRTTLWYIIVFFNKRAAETFLEKRVSMELITMTFFFERWKLGFEKQNITYEIILQKIKSHTCLEVNFQSTNDTNRRGHGVLFQSFSEA